MVNDLKLRSAIVLSILVLPMFLVYPAEAKSPWIRDEKYDWYDGVTMEPVVGVPWLDITKSSITEHGEALVLRIHVATAIKPEVRGEMAAFWWSIDADQDSSTGIVLEYLSDLGYDYGVRVKYLPDSGVWTAVLQDYSSGEIVQTDLETFSVNGATVSVWLPHSMIDWDTEFYWTCDTNDYHYGPGATGYIDKGMPEYAEY